jgi:hypothetical protein
VGVDAASSVSSLAPMMYREEELVCSRSLQKKEALLQKGSSATVELLRRVYSSAEPIVSIIMSAIFNRLSILAASDCCPLATSPSRRRWSLVLDS